MVLEEAATQLCSYADGLGYKAENRLRTAAILDEGGGGGKQQRKERKERAGGCGGDRTECGEIAKRNKTVSDKVAPQYCGHTSHR